MEKNSSGTPRSADVHADHRTTTPHRARSSAVVRCRRPKGCSADRPRRSVGRLVGCRVAGFHLLRPLVPLTAQQYSTGFFQWRKSPVSRWSHTLTAHGSFVDRWISPCCRCGSGIGQPPSWIATKVLFTLALPPLAIYRRFRGGVTIDWRRHSKEAS